MKMKVLYITDMDMFDRIKNGGQQVTSRNYKILQTLFGKDNISVLLFTKNKYTIDNQTIYTFPLANSPAENIFCALCGYRRFNPKYIRSIKRIISSLKPDIVYIDSSELGRILKWIDKSTKSIVFFHNIEVDYVWNNKIKRRKYYAFPILWAVFLSELLCTRTASKIICLTERDNIRMKNIYKRNADLVLPMGFEDIFDRNKLQRNSKVKKLLFVGSNFPPNYHGINWFIKNVMPMLNEFELVIVGKGFEKARKQLEKSNVKVVGTVDNLEDYYYSYCSIVMPILYGNGMKVKTAEAMMYGMNIFATDEALVGYNADGIEGIYRCNSAEEFVNAIKNAYNQNNIYECADMVRKKYISEFTVDSQINIMKEMVDFI